MTGNDRRFALEQAGVFDASAERVFGLLTEPEELAKWWGPHGFATPEIHIDLRVGGSLRFTMQPPEANRSISPASSFTLSSLQAHVHLSLG